MLVNPMLDISFCLNPFFLKWLNAFLIACSTVISRRLSIAGFRWPKVCYFPVHGFGYRLSYALCGAKAADNVIHERWSYVKLFGYGGLCYPGPHKKDLYFNWVHVKSIYRN